MGDQPERYEGKWWILNGVIWGIIMLCIMELLFPLFTNQEIDPMKVLSRGLPLWIIGGLCYGFTMKLVYQFFYPKPEL